MKALKSIILLTLLILGLPTTAQEQSNTCDIKIAKSYLNWEDNENTFNEADKKDYYQKKNTRLKKLMESIEKHDVKNCSANLRSQVEKVKKVTQKNINALTDVLAHVQKMKDNGLFNSTEKKHKLALHNKTQILGELSREFDDEHSEMLFIARNLVGWH